MLFKVLGKDRKTVQKVQNIYYTITFNKILYKSILNLIHSMAVRNLTKVWKTEMASSQGNGA